MIDLRPDPDARRLEAVIPLPPPDNHLHASGQYGRYPTAAYKTWLGLVAEPLQDALLAVGWAADTDTWWAVGGKLALPPRAGDNQNYLKASLDWLSGAYVDRGRIEHRGGWWDDDCRVVLGLWVPVEVRSPEPRVTLVVEAWPRELWPAPAKKLRRRTR